MSQVPAQPEKMSAQELRIFLQTIVTDVCTARDEIATLRAEMEVLSDNFQQMLDKFAEMPRGLPASSSSSQELQTVNMTSIVMTYDPKGQPMYHAIGGQYQKFGARIWPEYLSPLAIDPDQLRPGPNPWTKTVLVQPAKDGRAPKVVSLT